MHIKFLPHGKGSAMAAVNYLLDEKDHKGETRVGAQVLRGNPKLVGEVADCSPYEYHYTSGVIAWAPEDHISDERIQETLDDFETLAFAGLDANQYAMTAIQNESENGNKHIHVLVARVELSSGKSLNIAPPGWQKDFDAMRDHLNEKYQWARPDDPARARTIQLGNPKNTTTKQAKEAITHYLTEAIKTGQIQNRQDITEQLKSIGEITREGKDYISVKPQGFERAIRLKGGIYHEGFNAGSIQQNRSAEERAESTASRDTGNRIRELQTGFTAAISRCAEYNRQRYQQSRIQQRLNNLEKTNYRTKKYVIKLWIGILLSLVVMILVCGGAAKFYLQYQTWQITKLQSKMSQLETQKQNMIEEINNLQQEGFAKLMSQQLKVTYRQKQFYITYPKGIPKPQLYQTKNKRWEIRTGVF